MVLHGVGEASGPGGGAVAVDVSVAQKEVKTYTMTPGDPLSARVHIEHCLEMAYPGGQPGTATKPLGASGAGAPTTVEQEVAACMTALKCGAGDGATSTRAGLVDKSAGTASGDDDTTETSSSSSTTPWRTLIHTQSDMWSTADEFVLRNRVLAWEGSSSSDGGKAAAGGGGAHHSSGRKLVFDIVDEKRVPRRLV